MDYWDTRNHPRYLHDQAQFPHSHHIQCVKLRVEQIMFSHSVLQEESLPGETANNSKWVVVSLNDPDQMDSFHDPLHSPKSDSSVQVVIIRSL
jgi:hypothetical protein